MGDIGYYIMERQPFGSFFTNIQKPELKVIVCLYIILYPDFSHIYLNLRKIFYQYESYLYRRNFVQGIHKREANQWHRRLSEEFNQLLILASANCLVKVAFAKFNFSVTLALFVSSSVNLQSFFLFNSRQQILSQVIWLFDQDQLDQRI